MKHCTGACMDGRYECPHKEHCGQLSASSDEIAQAIVRWAIVAITCVALAAMVAAFMG